MEEIFSAIKGRWNNWVIFIKIVYETLEEPAFPKLLWEYLALSQLLWGVSIDLEKIQSIWMWSFLISNGHVGELAH